MAVASHLWWPLYFPAETYDARDRRAELSEQLIAYFSSEAGFRMVEQARRNSACWRVATCVS
jgi:hypothetical protein